MPEWPEEWQQYRAAKAWGMNPRDWRMESVDDRGIMLAIFLFESTCEAKRAEHRKDLMDREDKGNDTAGSDFRRLKERLKDT